ncbi:Uncharacterised protein [Mycobacteroides abscessus subsp. abscessus]|nr:Uncharacterised protein [Mycobacteroides abscessus subsp. abscessus]
MSGRVVTVFCDEECHPNGIWEREFRPRQGIWRPASIETVAGQVRTRNKRRPRRGPFPIKVNRETAELLRSDGSHHIQCPECGDTVRIGPVKLTVLLDRLSDAEELPDAKEIRMSLAMLREAIKRV